MEAVSVAGAASELGVSPRRVRQLLAAGDLRGQRLGREWVVDGGDVERHRRLCRLAGRPWQPASAWAVLAIADGQVPALSAVERSRARRRLAEHGLAGLADRLAARSDARRFYAHPAALDRLVREPEVVRGGLSAAAEHGVDLVGGELTEVYVPERRLPALVSRYALDGDAERPNLLLRVVDDDVWPFASDLTVASRPVVAVDLLESDDERARRAGHQLAGRHT